MQNILEFGQLISSEGPWSNRLISTVLAPRYRRSSQTVNTTALVTLKHAHTYLMRLQDITRIVWNCSIKFSHSTSQELYAQVSRFVYCLFKSLDGRFYSFPIYDDVIKWKHFPSYWSFVWEIHRSPVNSPHKGQWRGALEFSLICAWINDWVNNREADDLRHHRSHYDVIVMNLQTIAPVLWSNSKECG